MQITIGYINHMSCTENTQIYEVLETSTKRTFTVIVLQFTKVLVIVF